MYFKSTRSSAVAWNSSSCGGAIEYDVSGGREPGGVPSTGDDDGKLWLRLRSVRRLQLPPEARLIVFATLDGSGLCRLPSLLGW
eukprot:COSAG05_NODE_9450_length_623_cov_0.662214_2_plen_84_part_00